jgi:hypothetical protein
MDPTTLEALRAAEEAVCRLVEVCRRGGQLYARDPRKVAHVSRTGKWHLNAIAALCRELTTPRGDQDGKKGA